MLITIKDIMIIERVLLEIDNRIKFDLSLNDLLKVYDYTKQVGRITNLYFLLQEEYYRKYGDKELLKKYHDELLNGNIELDSAKDIYGLVLRIYSSSYDEEFKNIVKDSGFLNLNDVLR